MKKYLSLLKKTKLMINFDLFYENTSTREALIMFAKGYYNSKQFEEACWPDYCKAEIRKMRNKIGIKRSRTKTRRHLSKIGIDWK